MDRGGSGGIAVDKKGNVHITGFFTSSTITFGSFPLNNLTSGGYNTFLAKYDSNGNVLWAESETASVAAAGPNSAGPIAIDKKGNIYITGAYANGVEGSITKYDSIGTVKWTEIFSGSASSSHPSECALAVDTNGNIYITGMFGNNTFTFGSITITNGNMGGQNFAVFIVKYDSSGTAKWAQSAGGYTDTGTGLAIDNNNDIYLSGCFAGSSIVFGTYTLYRIANNSPNEQDGFFVKYNVAGNVLWADRVAGSGAAGADHNAGAAGIAINSGNIYTTGYFAGDSITFGS